jgi:hypothetical protein
VVRAGDDVATFEIKMAALGSAWLAYDMRLMMAGIRGGWRQPKARWSVCRSSLEAPVYLEDFVREVLLRLNRHKSRVTRRKLEAGFHEPIESEDLICPGTAERGLSARCPNHESDIRFNFRGMWPGRGAVVRFPGRRCVCMSIGHPQHLDIPPRR